ncbi:hypothetical protein H5410_047118, partial [Solanum commersonii]
MVLIDLENSYDKASRNVLQRCLEAKDVPIVFIRMIKDMNNGKNTQTKMIVLVVWSGGMSSQELPCSKYACCQDKDVKMDMWHTMSNKIRNEVILKKACAKEVHRCRVRRGERLVVDSTWRDRGRPKKYWREVIRQDMTQFHITNDVPLDRKKWRSRAR